MKRGHAILIAGAALLVAGIVLSIVWGISFAGSFIAENTIIHRAIGPSESIEVVRNVTSPDTPLFLAVGVDPQQSLNDGYALKETVTDPDGRLVSRDEFQESFSTTISPQVTGEYVAVITNIGAETVTVSGTFGHVPFLGVNGQPNLDDMMSVGGVGMIIAGGGLATAGIIGLIVGAIVTIMDGRKREGTTTTASEGGITYRKD